MKTFEYTTSHTSNKLVITTDAELSGRGIKMISNGETNLRGLKRYMATESAFNKVAPTFATYK